MHPCECRSGEGQLSSQIELELVVAATAKMVRRQRVAAVGKAGFAPADREELLDEKGEVTFAAHAGTATRIGKVTAAHLSFAIEDAVGAIGNMALEPVPKHGFYPAGKTNDNVVGPLAAAVRRSLEDGGDFGVVETRNEGRHVDADRDACTRQRFNGVEAALRSGVRGSIMFVSSRRRLVIDRVTLTRLSLASARRMSVSLVTRWFLVTMVTGLRKYRNTSRQRRVMARLRSTG